MKRLQLLDIGIYILLASGFALCTIALDREGKLLEMERHGLSRQ